MSRKKVVVGGGGGGGGIGRGGLGRRKGSAASSHHLINAAGQVRRQGHQVRMRLPGEATNQRARSPVRPGEGQSIKVTAR